MTFMRKLLYPLQQYGNLCKPRVSFFAALSAMVGLLLSPFPTIGTVVPLALVVFLLACGGSALNQYQERAIDALMERTRHRPIPAGRIRPLSALRFALAVLGFALSMLAVVGGIKALLLGLFAVLWYNLLYTYLKRRSAFAVIPGALVGVIPPAIGWVAGGGAISDARLGAIGFLFFLWQVPHFWLLMLDRGKEYEKAGLPTLHALFREESLRRIIFHWIVALAVGSLCISLYGLVDAPLIQGALFTAAVWIIWNGRSLLAGDGRDTGRLLRMVNAYMVIIALGVALDAVFVPHLSSRFLPGLF
jgi:protoheme IX farnesyltransferase